MSRKKKTLRRFNSLRYIQYKEGSRVLDSFRPRYPQEKPIRIAPSLHASLSGLEVTPPANL